MKVKSIVMPVHEEFEGRVITIGEPKYLLYNGREYCQNRDNIYEEKNWPEAVRRSRGFKKTNKEMPLERRLLAEVFKAVRLHYPIRPHIGGLSEYGLGTRDAMQGFLRTFKREYNRVIKRGRR